MGADRRSARERRTRAKARVCCQAHVKLPDGFLWKDVVTEEVSKVAETLNEFRGRYRYNLMDANVRRMAADMPQIWQWDDHEACNNWPDSKDLSGDKRYQKAPNEVNAPPTNGMQFFGQVDIDARTGEMTVTLKDLVDDSLYTKTLSPQRG